MIKGYIGKGDDKYKPMLFQEIYTFFCNAPKRAIKNFWIYLNSKKYRQAVELLKKFLGIEIPEEILEEFSKDGDTIDHINIVSNKKKSNNYYGDNMITQSNKHTSENPVIERKNVNYPQKGFLPREQPYGVNVKKDKGKKYWGYQPADKIKPITSYTVEQPQFIQEQENEINKLKDELSKMQNKDPKLIEELNMLEKKLQKLKRDDTLPTGFNMDKQYYESLNMPKTMNANKYKKYNELFIWACSCDDKYNEDNQVAWAREELQRAGLFDEDSDYNGAIGESILDIMKKFSSQEHSGGSAGMITSILDKLLKYRPLTPLTDNPAEWMEVTEDLGGEKTYQSKRCPFCFSTDDLKYYYDLDDYNKDKLYELQHYDDSHIQVEEPKEEIKKKDKSDMRYLNVNDFKTR